MPNQTEMRLRNLARANEIRTARRRHKEGLRRLPAPLALAVATEELRTAPAGLLHSMPTREFLETIPRVGRVRSGALLHEAQIANRPIGDLTPDARDRLTRSLHELAERRYGKEAVHG